MRAKTHSKALEPLMRIVVLWTIAQRREGRLASGRRSVRKVRRGSSRREGGGSTGTIPSRTRRTP